MQIKFKFHLVATLTNSGTILLLLKVHQFVINKFVDNLFFLREEGSFYGLYLVSIFLISWLAPFAIYLSKNYKKHFFIFLFSLWIIIFIIITYKLIYNFHQDFYPSNGLLNYSIENCMYIFFKQETLSISILVSIVIYINQIIIGRKLLPIRYRKI